MLYAIPEHWLTYLYQFGIGGIFFAAGLFAILKTRACDLRIPADRTWFAALIIGYLALAGAFALWIYVATHTPSYEGPPVLASALRPPAAQSPANAATTEGSTVAPIRPEGGR